MSIAFHYLVRIGALEGMRGNESSILRWKAFYGFFKGLKKNFRNFFLSFHIKFLFF
jgi:hypothetical protein